MPKRDNEQEIKDDIDNTADGQVIHGPAAVPYSPQYRPAEIVNHTGRKTKEIDPGIQNR